ncbi:MAG: hypothetical protein R2875_17760 [Desulfobacterales bacterium]
MKPEISQQKQTPAVDIELLAGLLAKMQKASGEIPWSEGGKTDPWDHIEAAMGLCIGGYVDEARRAYEWLADIQLEDGAWYASYIDGKPLDRTRDTNVSTYIAVGVYHYYHHPGSDVCSQNVAHHRRGHGICHQSSGTHR